MLSLILALGCTEGCNPDPGTPLASSEGRSDYSTANQTETDDIFESAAVYLQDASNALKQIIS